MELRRGMSAPLRQALFIGAGGDIARAVARRLSADHQVVGISRRADAPDPVYSGHHRSDLSQASPDAIAETLDGQGHHCDLLFCALGTLHVAEHRPEKRRADLEAERLCGVIESLGPEETGRFLHRDGSDLSW